MTETKGDFDLDINELSEESGHSVRNLRAYLQMGVLHPGTKRGRSLRFDLGHIERLRQVDELRDRGYSLAAIRDVLSGAQPDPTTVDVDAIAEILARWSDPGDQGGGVELGLASLATPPIDLARVEAVVDRLTAHGVDVAAPGVDQAIVALTRAGLGLIPALELIEAAAIGAHALAERLERCEPFADGYAAADVDRRQELWPAVLTAVAAELNRRFSGSDPRPVSTLRAASTNE